MATKRISVLGTGMVGSLIAIDLADESDVEVTALDADERAESRLRRDPRVRFERADLSDVAVVRRVAERSDVVVNSLPGFLGFEVLRAVIEAGRNAVDVSFMPQDPFDLAPLAAARGVSVVVDCGVAPGLSNLIVGRAAADLEPLDSVRVLVGGLPVVRRWPFEYCAVFSPIDVIEEYTRPARLVEDGWIVVREPLSEIEPVEIPEVGTLEAFNSDGLRTLVKTVKARRMAEKTLRYPGHADRIRLLRATGFFSTDPVEVDGRPVRPIDVTAKLLFHKWRLPEGEGDITVMRIEIQGERSGRPERHVWSLVDRWDPASRRTAMARTTGFPAAIAARLLLHGQVVERGIVPPEVLGRDEHLYRVFIEELTRRSVNVRHQVVASVPPR